MKYFHSPSELVKLVEALEPSNSDYIVVTLNDDCELTSIVLTEEVEYRNTIKNIASTKYYDGHLILIRGADTYNPTYLDAYQQEVEELAGELAVLDIVCVDWTEATFYSDICKRPKDCCGPDNQQSYGDFN